MTQDTDSGKGDANNTGVAGITPAAQEIAMLLSLQKKEWQELRSTDGVVLKFINLQEPTSKRKVLLIAIGTKTDDLVGNNATLDVFINGLSIDAIVERVATNQEVKP